MYNLDSGKELDHGQLHYAIFGDWGSVYLRWCSESSRMEWFHRFKGTPVNWEELTEWLNGVEKGLSSEYNLEAFGLADAAREDLQRAWQGSQ